MSEEVILVSGASSPVQHDESSTPAPVDAKVQERRSWIWSYVRRVDRKESGSDNIVSELVCEVKVNGRPCGDKYKFDKTCSHRGMKQHLRTHGLSPDGPIQGQSSITRFMKGGSLQNEHRPFEEKGFQKLLTKFFVSANLPAAIVENKDFRALLDYCNPLAHRMMISRNTLNTRIATQYKSTKELVKQELATVQKISITCDLWTAPNNTPVLGITAHYIDTLTWTLQERLLELIEIEGSHSGQNVSEYLLACLKDFDIQESLFCITADNASSNATMGRAIEKTLLSFSVEDNLLGCIGHILNLAAQKSIKTLNNQTLTNLSSTIPSDMLRILDDDHINISSKSVVNKIRTVSKAVKRSPQQQQTFERSLALAPPKDQTKATTLLLDICTRWNSTYTMLQRALSLRSAIDLYIQSQSYAEEEKITASEWQACEQVMLILQPLAEVTEILSSSKTSISISQAFVSYEAILAHLKQKENTHEYRTLKPTMLSVIDKLIEYQSKVMSKQVYRNATILDPRFKLDPFPEDKAKVLQDEFAKAAAEYSIDYAVTSTRESVNSGGNSILGSIYKKRKIRSLDTEVEEYLRDPTIDADDDPLDYWQSRQNQFPSLARFAAAVLAIPATSTPSERAFSLGGRIMTDNRCSMSIATLNSLACLNDWYRNGVDTLDDRK